MKKLMMFVLGIGMLYSTGLLADCCDTFHNLTRQKKSLCEKARNYCKDCHLAPEKDDLRMWCYTACSLCGEI